MAKTLQFRRGTTVELSTETGAVGELFVDAAWIVLGEMVSFG